MNTPYDAALRVRQRELDQVSTAIHAETGTLSALECERVRVQAALRAEAELVADDHALTSPAWQGRMRGQRRDLTILQTQVQERVAQLRDRVIDVYGTLRGIEMAAKDYRGEAARAQAAVEQATSDDLSAVAVLRTVRAARRARR